MVSQKKIAKLERKLADPGVAHVRTDRNWGEDYRFDVPAGTTLFVTGNASIEVTGDGVVHVDDSATVDASGNLRVIAEDRARVFADDNVQALASGNTVIDVDGAAAVSAVEYAVVYAEGYGAMRVFADDRVTVHAGRHTTVSAKGDAHVFSNGSAVTATASVTVRGEVAAPAPEQLIPWGEEPVYVRDGGAVAEWCARYGIEIKDGILRVFKGVGHDGKSESFNETTLLHTEYGPGLMPEAADWDTGVHCGGGLHFSPSVADTLEYRDDAARWFRCAVRVDEVVVLGDKIKAKRVVEPMVEVDLFGEPLDDGATTAPDTF